MYYDDGTVQIHLGDCREILPTVGSVDHVLTDPPYSRDVYVRAPADRGGSDYELKRGEALSKLGAGAIGAVDDLAEPVAQWIGKHTRRWALVFSDAEFTYRWRQLLEAAGLRYVRTGAWVKPDAMPQMSGDRPSVGFEPCTICHAKGAMRWNGGGRQAVWTYLTVKGNGRPDHPCPKPEPLMAELISLFTDPGEVILDPFMGSGTTLAAAKRLGRKAIGIDCQESYCERAAKRLSQGALPLAW